MGYGVPAAVAAKIAEPNRMVVSLAGDGCFLMNGQEFATAVQYGANIVIAVIDNGMYGTIRMHQEREYPTRVHGTELKNPDFAAYARAFGGHGETVEKTEDFAPGVRARARRRQARDHPREDRSRGADLADHAHQAARAVAGAAAAAEALGTCAGRPLSI